MGFFFFFWQRRHSKRPATLLSCRLQVLFPNSAEKLGLCRWRKPADLWCDPRLFHPLSYHMQNTEVQTDASEISGQVQRYTKMINTATILQSPEHHQQSGPISGYQHPNGPKVSKSSRQSQKPVLFSLAPDKVHQ